MSELNPQSDGRNAAWQSHNLAQLHYFRSLNLRQKMEAVESMDNLFRRFQQARKAGAFFSSAQVRVSPSGDVRNNEP